MRMTEEEFQAFMERRRGGRSLHSAPAPASATVEMTKKTKYGNRRVTVDGQKFDSKHEADVYQGLIFQVRTGELKAVIRQVPFDLPGGIKYYADFVTIDPENRITVYDAKSEATRKNRVYINKRKQVKACWGIDIVEV